DRVESAPHLCRHHELVSRTRRPDLANCIVRPRDPHILSTGNWLAFGRRGQALRVVHDSRLTRTRRGGLRRRAEVAVAELPPDRVCDVAEVLAGMRLHRLDTRLALDGVVALPSEDLVGEVVEIFVDTEAAARKHL